MFKVNNKNNRKTSKLGSHLPKKVFYLLQKLPFKNDECFLFHLKGVKLRFVLKIFVLTFWACKENGLIRKIRLISKFMMSQHG